MMEERQASSVRFEWITDEQPHFDVGWESVVSDAADILWRVSAKGTLAEVRPHLEQRRTMAAAWESYAQQVAQSVQLPYEAVAGQSETAPAVTTDDVEARLMGYAERLLRQPLIVETILNGERLARTRVVWETGEQKTTWYVPEVTPEEGALHNETVEAAGRTLLALAKREASMGLALLRVPQEPGLTPSSLKAAVQQRVASLVPPAPASLMNTPSPAVLTPCIVTRQSALAIDWCWVPGGTFTMGSERSYDERPIHEVHVDGFWMMRYPATNAQYRQFIEAGGYTEKRWWTDAGWRAREENDWTEPRYWNEKKWNDERQPVVGVSWYEAVAFCRWASSVTGQEVRLPTEAEWEKAARGTDGREYPWGNAEPNADLCNFGGNVGQTTPVGQYSPEGDGPYGCADMAGNVWEWCGSKKYDYPYVKDDGRNDVDGTDARVLRGGSWADFRNNVRAALRDWNAPGYWDNDNGFRCASTPF